MVVLVSSQACIAGFFRKDFPWTLTGFNGSEVCMGLRYVGGLYDRDAGVGARTRDHGIYFGSWQA